MVDATQIPFEVRRAMRIEWAKRNNSDGPDKHMTDLAVAMLNAWPGALHRIGIKRHKNGEWRQPYPMICLPLPQEASDDQ